MNGLGEFGGACGAGIFAVLGLFLMHFCKDCTATAVRIGQLLEVTGKVLTNLVFCLGDETEAPAIAQRAARRADDKRSGVPQRAQAARLRIQLGKSLLTPGKVVVFLVCRTLHLGFDRGAPGHGRVTLVEPLRGDLAGMIDPHQTRSVRFLCRCQCALRYAVSGVGPRRAARRSGDGFERRIDPGEESVQRG